MFPNPVGGSAGAALGSLLRAGWRLPGARMLSFRDPVVLLYHGVPRTPDGRGVAAGVFERHVAFLAENFELVSLPGLSRTRRRAEGIRVLLTFDDGFRNNAEVVAPILRSHGVSAIFFVSSRHATRGKYLWFSYLRALRRSYPDGSIIFRGERMDMSPGARAATVDRLRRALGGLTPYPAAMYRTIEEELPPLDEFVSGDEIADRYAGMTKEQVGELAADPLFTVGTHAIDHPFLTMCSAAEAARQIDENRRWIEDATGQSCSVIAYPHGDYDDEVLAHCRDAEFEHGFAVDPRVRSDAQLERPRIGVYSMSTDALGFKVQWGNLMRLMRIPVG